MPTPVRLLVRIHLPVSSGPRNKAVSSRTRHVISGVKQKAPKEEHLLEADIHIISMIVVAPTISFLQISPPVVSKKLLIHLIRLPATRAGAKIHLSMTDLHVPLSGKGGRSGDTGCCKTRTRQAMTQRSLSLGLLVRRKGKDAMAPFGTPALILWLVVHSVVWDGLHCNSRPLRSYQSFR